MALFFVIVSTISVHMMNAAGKLLVSGFVSKTRADRFKNYSFKPI